MNNERLKRILVFFAVFSVFEYLAFHALYLLTDSLAEYILLQIRVSVSMLPVMAAVAVIREGIDTRRVLLHLGYIALERIPFSFLYAYMFIVLYYRTVSTEALLYSILLSVGIAFVYFLLFIAVYGLVHLSFRLSGREYDAVGCFPIRISNLSCPLVRGLSILPFTVFLIELVFEIIATVSYFTSYGAAYRAGEIIYMVFSYILLIVIFLSSMLMAAGLGNRFLRDRAEGEQE